MLNVVRSVLVGLVALLRTRASLAVQVAALEQQLGVLTRHKPRPRLSVFDRMFWIALCRNWTGWTRALVIVKPATVLRWHRAGYRLFWSWRSRLGRPRIPREHIDLIRQLGNEHPELGEDQLALELEAKLGVRHASSTIRRYRLRPTPPERPRRDSQSWSTFIRNHADAIWACDFLVQYTARFTGVYIFVIVELGSRRIVWLNATESPSLAWVQSQIRQACPEDCAPRFLIHDNDGIFGQLRKRAERPRFRCSLDAWLATVMGIRGIPIPYRARNANAHAERLNRTLREHVLDHFVFLNARHVVRVLREYVRYYNHARPSQAIGKIPDPYPELRSRPPPRGRVVALPVLGGLHHDYRRAA